MVQMHIAPRKIDINYLPKSLKRNQNQTAVWLSSNLLPLSDTDIQAIQYCYYSFCHDCMDKYVEDHIDDYKTITDREECIAFEGKLLRCSAVWKGLALLTKICWVACLLVLSLYCKMYLKLCL